MISKENSYKFIKVGPHKNILKAKEMKEISLLEDQFLGRSEDAINRNQTQSSTT